MSAEPVRVRRKAVHAHEKIAADYRHQIETGKLLPGDVMPPLSKVREVYGCSQNVASAAYQMLKGEGLVITRPGAGTIVAERPRVVPATGAQRADRVESGGPNYAHGEESTGHTSELRSCADLGVCRDLGIDAHDEVVLRKRVFRRDGHPTVLAISVINPRAAAAVPELLESRKLPFYWHDAYADRTGRRIWRLPERRTARLASRDELKALEVPLPSDVDVAVPVLVKYTVWHDDQGPIEVWEDVLAPGLWDTDRTPPEEETSDGETA
jgi:GntR family transcriptional regulator